MYPNDRFYGCESLGFPEVSTYDYNENIPNRGIEDRKFRWEEVSAPFTYMLKEATVSGSFEGNTFSFTNGTGLNYITTGLTSGNSSNFPGWNITGSRTVWIGQSGIYINSGDIPGVTSSFHAFPIDGNRAVGLFCSSTGNTTSPAVYSNLLSTGDEGPIILGGRHQLYLQTKLNYGTTGSLKAYIRGWNAGSIVAYYNALDGEWGSTIPSSSFSLPNNNITTIKYDFTCTGFPAATPTSFDVYITNNASGTFTTVDNIHLDTYFKENAFIDFLVPSGYVIQVTPDIGWHNIIDMFNSNQDLVNPHLATLGPFAVNLGNLQDNLDNTVTATLDYSDFFDTTKSNFKKYLWRAIALTPNGQLGLGGYPQRFTYIGDEVNKLFTVDNIYQDDLSTIKIITGTKSKTMTILVDNSPNHPGLTYPTPTSWKLEINVNAAQRTITVRGIDLGGNLSSFKKITLTNKLYDQTITSLWNVFDEHGLVADIERLPDESNYDFSLRIKDAYRSRGGPSFVGIVNGATRELNLEKIPDGIKLLLSEDENKNTIASSVSVEVTAYSIRVTSSSFVKEERVFVDPVYGTAQLSYFPLDIPNFCEIDGGGPVPLTKLSIVEQDDKSRYHLMIGDTKAYGKFINIKYPYAIEILFKNNATLESVINALNTVTTEYGQRIFTCSISSRLSGNENSLGLYITNFTAVPREESVIGWSPIVLKKIADRGYRDYFIKEEDDNLKNTKYYSFVEELKNTTKIFWGSVEADRARWDSADSKDLAMDTIPTLFDPPLTRILFTFTGTRATMDPVQVWGRNNIGLDGEYLVNAGLSETFFHPGVAHKNDLEPSIYVTSSKVENITGLFSNIGPARNFNNTVVFHSGQR